ncbi:MAG TPA: Bax inhibitor-1/YccA family protein, partial [Cellulomonas sp.]|nr:Bax inhibitor-1/YccA family protein [Cellulomonas sp.]
MANPVFSNSPVFGDPNAKKGNARTAAPESTIDAVTLEKMYGAPSATTRETGRMTYDDVIVKTGGLLALLVVVAAGTWA